MTSKDVERLEHLLDINLKYLGFSLEFFEAHPPTQVFGTIVRGIVRCPCGGLEYFAAAKHYFETPKQIAKSCLKAIASEQHLLEDIENGTLPAFDYQKHVFKELVT
jgi:hypothetical protein